MVTIIFIWLVAGVLIGALISFITRDEFTSYQYNLVAGSLGAIAGGLIAGSATGSAASYSVLGATIVIMAATFAVVGLNGFRRGATGR